MALFGKNNHHSVLDENSTFYSPQESKTEKQKWSEMNTPQRLRYFKDYYLLKCLILLFAVSLTGILLYSFFKPQKTRMLFVAVVQNTLLPEGKEQLKQHFEKLLISDDNSQEILLDDTFPMGYETEAKLAAYIGSKEVDLIITNEERFQEMAETGFFEDLTIFAPELTETYSNDLIWTEETKNSNEKAIKHTAYGIRITDCDAFKNAWPADTDAIIGVMVNSQNKANARIAIEGLLFK